MFLDRAMPAYSPDELSQRKEQAKRLMQDPFFLSIMEEAEASSISEWLTNVDKDARERCWLLCKGLDLVMLRLRQVVDEAE